MKKKRIAIDMDDVLADTNGKFVDIYLAGEAPRYTVDELKTQSFHELLDEHEFNALLQHVYEPGFFRDIRVMPGAQEAIERLSERYEIFVATAAMEFPNSFRDKYDWLAEHFPSIHWRNIIFMGDKSVLNTDYLIDDLPRNLVTFQGEGLLFSAVHNRTNQEFRRFDTWPEIERYLL
ncbi:5' nucleotidase, NT5C type [Arsenicibacter rosenii]|uniref:5'(3')-deoxyribonucleotidase n=1 Tax=Arsenicibacter rosenii TaxID=1750698 RepID=A0A1S2VGL2_9BACT|nr:5'(3')-deoxyribonucleotidase [Arsenicibacter rosenii]OIN57336.1 5'(3')-deoxyribonucleotidase [Arsenicibacter rosenii]